MTHSWPPPLTAIHTPGKADQTKFPIPNKVGSHFCSPLIRHSVDVHSCLEQKHIYRNVFTNSTLVTFASLTDTVAALGVEQKCQIVQKQPAVKPLHLSAAPAIRTTCRLFLSPPKHFGMTV